MTLKLDTSRGYVRWLEPPKNLIEVKQLIQAYIKHHDYYGLTQQRKWLRKVHGDMIDKVVDSWINEMKYHGKV